MRRKGRKGIGGGRRRLVAMAVAGSMAALGQLAVATPGLADTVVGCGVAATVDFSPNGPGLSADMGWSMHGTLFGCLSNGEGAPTGGTVSVGKALRVSVPITLANGAVVQGKASYQEPAGSGLGYLPENSCAATNLFAINAFYQWDDGTITQSTMSIVSAGPVAQYQGFVTTGSVLPLIPGSETPPGSAPSTYTVFSNNPSFDQASMFSGAAVVTRANPLACATTQGLSSASALGAVEFGESLSIPRP